MTSALENVNSNSSTGKNHGELFLVGAGPGSVDLITCRGAEVLANAQVVLADGLVSEEFRSLASADVKWINVSKRADDAVITQKEIIDIMITEVRAGYCVVRLKGGDVGIFARTGEELYSLREAGIEVSIIPGVTAASAAAAAASFSLTHRDFSSLITIVTGNDKFDKFPPLEDFVNRKGTLVIYMGLRRVEDIFNALIAKNYSLMTPLVVVENALSKNERILYGALGDLEELVIKNNVITIIIIMLRSIYNYNSC